MAASLFIWREVLEAATLRIDGETVAVAANEVDDQPDDSDQDEERGEGDQEPEASGEDSLRATNHGSRGQVRVAGRDGQVAADLCLVAKVKIAAKNGDVAGDVVVGVDGDVAEENGYIASDVAVNVDGAEGAGNISGGFTFVDGDVVSDAGSVLLRAGECRERGGKQEGGGEEQFMHERPRGASVRRGMF